MKKNYTPLWRGILYMLPLFFLNLQVLNAQIVVQTFSYTGTIVNFTVPTCVTVLTIQAKGAQGGFHPTSSVGSGLGADITGVVTVAQGQVLRILVGQQPSPPDGNGGGGGTFVTDLANNPLVIAGGGGGSSGGTDSPDKHGQSGTSGGQGAGGGGTGGTAGNGGNIGASFASGAGGGLLTNGATGWTANTGGNSFVSGGLATAQTAIGGFGGGGSGSLYVVGGGGGGYSGGGSGSNASGSGVGGGGGSFNSGTNQVNLSGINSGHGLVIITYNTGGSGVVASMSPTVGICPGATATLTAGGNVLTYTWTNTPPGQQTILVSPGVTTSYTLMGTNATGCVSSAVVNVTVHPLPTLTLTSNKALVCVGESATLIATGANTYSWVGGSSSATNVITPTVNVSTTYTAIGTSTAGCINTEIITPSVNPLQMSASPNTVVCMGKGTLLTASGAMPGTYSWLNNTTGGITPFQSTTASPTVLTIYTASGIDPNNCPQSVTVSVGVNPNPPVTISATSTLICKGHTATLTAGGAATYSWSTTESAASITISPVINTTFVYSVTGTDGNSCSTTTNVAIKVELCTGVDEISSAGTAINIYPNPGTGVYQLKLDRLSTGKNTLNVYNASGALIKTMEIVSEKTEVDLRQQAAGIYFVQLMNGTNDGSVTKIIKE